MLFEVPQAGNLDNLGKLGSLDILQVLLATNLDNQGSLLPHVLHCSPMLGLHTVRDPDNFQQPRRLLRSRPQLLVCHTVCL